MTSEFLSRTLSNRWYLRADRLEFTKNIHCEGTMVEPVEPFPRTLDLESLVGGFDYFLFFHLVGTDKLIFFRGVAQPRIRS